MKRTIVSASLSLSLVSLGCGLERNTGDLESIHERFVFADIHAHPSRFHRANIETIGQEEMQRYVDNKMDVVVANVSTDAAYDGGYVKKDSTRVGRLPR